MAIVQPGQRAWGAIRGNRTADASLKELFVANRGEGIDADRAAGGKVASNRGGDQQEHCNAYVNENVDVRNVEQNPGEKPGRYGGRSPTEQKARGGETETLFDDEPKNMPRLRPKRDSNTDLAGAACNVRGERTEQSNTSKQNSERAENRAKRSDKAVGVERIVELTAERTNSDERSIGIEREVPIEFGERAIRQRAKCGWRDRRACLGLEEVGGLFAKTRVFRVRNKPHDFQRRPVAFDEAKTAADGVCVSEIPVGHRAIDDGDVCGLI